MATTSIQQGGTKSCLPRVSVVFNPPVVEVTAGGTASTVLTLSASPSAAKGTYTLGVEIAYEQGTIMMTGILLQVS